MELRHLRTFRAVAINRSFTRAANELGYVQSAITSHVKRTSMLSKSTWA